MQKSNEFSDDLRNNPQTSNYFWLDPEFPSVSSAHDNVTVNIDPNSGICHTVQNNHLAILRQNVGIVSDSEVHEKNDDKYETVGVNGSVGDVKELMVANSSAAIGSLSPHKSNKMAVIECNYAMLKEKIQIAYEELEKSKEVRNELERELRSIYGKYEAIRHEYDNTMRERKDVLEENERLVDENASLTQQINRFYDENKRLFEEKDCLEAKLQRYIANVNKDVRHLQQFRNDSYDLRKSLILESETSVVSSKHNEAINEEVSRLRLLCDKLTKERNEALLKLRCLNEVEAPETILNIWDTLTFNLNLPSASPNLGVILGGGKGDDIVGHESPIYIKEVLPGSPFEPHLQKLDYIIEVNGIEVAGMDQHSVTSILSNSKKLSIEVKRRNQICNIAEVSLGNASGKLGIELETGVIISELSENAGLESGLCVGMRLFHVNGIPIVDPLQAKALIQENKKKLILGISSKKHNTQQLSVASSRLVSPVASTVQEKQPRTHILNKIQEKLFGRSGNEKTRAVIAKANLDAWAGDLTTYRHGSLRVPSSRVNVLNDELIRTGSLRATLLSGDQRQSIPGVWTDKIYHRQSQSTQQKSNESKKLPRITRSSQCTSQCSHPNKMFQSTPSSVCSATTAHIVNSTNALIHPKLIGVAHAQRINTIPEPPPYPGQHFTVHPSIDSLSLASSNSYPVVPQSSSASFQNGYSITSTVHKQSSRDLSKEEKDVRCVVIHQDSKADDFGFELENVNGGVVISRVRGAAKDLLHVGEQLIDVNGVNMRLVNKDAANRVLKQLSNHNEDIALTVKETKEGPRWVHSNRKEVILCGGNGVGILVEKRLGELRVGERILEIDGKDVRKATLEEARRALDTGQSEIVNLLCEYDGGARYERLHNGADPDSFYIKVNIDRPAKNSDELELKNGEILYVDYTMFGNEMGKWRAWRIDHEGRQRQCGIIPSFARITDEETRRTRRTRGRPSESLYSGRFLYERVERVSSLQKRPLILFSAYLAPFMQTLVDEHGDKFAQCVAECLAMTDSDARRAKSMSQFIEVRRREEVFEVVSVSSLQQIINNGYHCILDVAPQAVAKLRNMHLYPIFIRIRFKNAKQLKEFAEECGNERLNNKAAKELIERAETVDNQLRNMECAVSTISVGSHHGRNAVRYVCHQIVATVEHEQKRSVWAPANCTQTISPR
uniref:PDZ domain-containing protein n=1 Tax=Syphacia muris TaxID=451379 RepID=A0A0N5AG24_9BILA